MRALLPYLRLYRLHKWRLILGVVLAIVTLLASIGLLTLSGWFLAASALAGFAGLYSFNYMLPAAGVRGAAIFRTAGRYFERVVSHDATFRVLLNLRVFTFSRLLPLTPGGLARYQKGELLNRLVADVDTLDHLYLRVLSPLAGALAVIGVVTFGLSFINVSVALTLGAILLATLLVLPPLFWLAGRRPGETMTTTRSHYRQLLVSWLQCQAEIKLFGASACYRQALDNTEQAWLSAQRQQASLSALAQAVMMMITGLTVVLMLWLAAAGIGQGHNPGALIALFVFCAMAAFEALAPVSGAFQHLGQVAASARRLTQITSQVPDVTFPTSATPAPITTASLEIAGVEFHYPGQTQPVLRGFSLTVPPGCHLALLGSTGCGKSTLLALLTRAGDPQHGTLSLNGLPLPQWDETSLRQIMAVVPQRVHLFSATLRDNLLLAAPGADDQRLAATLTAVGLHGLLEDAGLNAWLGEGGRQLSGGELRRLGIARALLHDGPLLLLDEPTEGLDAETESQILALLRQHAQGKTLIMVTHRLTGLAAMDQIVVMDDGRILEQGPHAALLAADGRYVQLLRSRRH